MKSILKRIKKSKVIKVLLNAFCTFNKTFYAFENKVKHLFKNNYKFIVVNVLFGAFVYYMLMSHDLVNDVDGLWNLSNYLAGVWEISIGRWGLYVIDSIFNGVVSISLRTFISLTIVSISNLIAFKILGINNKYVKYLLSFIIIASPIVSTTLTYSYTAVGYFTAYLFSTISVYVLEFSDYKGKCFVAGLLIAIMLSIYQAYLDVVCILIVYLIIKKVIEGIKTKELFIFIFNSVFTALVGAIFYKIILNFVINITNIELADYRNLTNISFGFIIKNLPKSILFSYKTFIYFFNWELMLLNMKCIHFVIGFMFIFIFIRILLEFIRISKKNLINAIVLLIFTIIIPIASNIALVLAPGNYAYNLTNMGMFYIIVLFAMLYSMNSKLKFISIRFVFIFLIVFLWINVIKIENDQVSLYEGRNSTITIAQNIMDDLLNMGYCMKNKSIAIIGKPYKNQLFKINEAMTWSNNYAQFGAGWGWNGNYYDQSWKSIYNNFLGVEMVSATNSTFDEILNSDWIKNIPTYPTIGSIVEYGDTVVIKISDDFE